METKNLKYERIFLTFLICCVSSRRLPPRSNQVAMCCSSAFRRSVENVLQTFHPVFLLWTARVRVGDRWQLPLWWSLVSVDDNLWTPFCWTHLWLSDQQARCRISNKLCHSWLISCKMSSSLPPWTAICTMDWVREIPASIIFKNDSVINEFAWLGSSKIVAYFHGETSLNLTVVQIVGGNW